MNFVRQTSTLALLVAGIASLGSIPAFAQCGGYERWAVKVGSDPTASTINLSSVIPLTVANVIGLPRPATLPSNNDGTRLASEKQVYSVVCRLVKFKQEGGTGDMDYHLVLSDDTLIFTDDAAGVPAGHSFVAESVSPSCISGSHSDGPSTSVWQSYLVSVRNIINARFPTIPSSGWVDAKGVQVRVTGVGFFDFVHGQTGRTSATGATFELHPLTNIEFLDTPSGVVTAGISAPASDTTIASGASVAFTGSATDSVAGSTFTYGWNFGDGTTGTGASLSHVFTNTGTTAVTRSAVFTATDNHAVSGSATRLITVNPASAPPPPPSTFNEVEPNNSTAAANVVPDTATKIVGYFPSASDNADYFKLNLLPGHTLTIDMVGPTASAQDYDLYLLSSTGATLTSSTGSTTTEHVSYKNTSTTASKVIYVEVSRYASYSSVTPYTLTMSR
jgi:hypothetical protein